MGESYKGLTIRIGADTLEFQRAMTTMSDAASRAQTSIARIGKALKLDPTNVTSLNLKIQALGEKMQAAAGNMANLRDVEKQFKATPFYEAAKGIDNISMNTAQALSQFNAVNRQLEILRQSLKEIARKNGFKELAKENDVKTLIAGLRGCSDEVNRLEEAHEKLVKEWHRLSGEDGKSGTLEIAKQAERYRDLKIEMQIVAAEARKMAEEFVALKSTTAVIEKQSDAFKTARRNMELAQKAADALNEELKQTEEVLKLDPASVDALINRQRTYNDLIEVTQKELTEARAKLTELSQKVDLSNVTKDAEQLHLAFEKSKDSAAETEAEVKSLEGRLSQLNERAEELRLNGIMGGKTQKELEKVEAEIKRVNALLPETKAKAAAAMAELEKKEAEVQVRKLSNEVTTLDAKLKGLKTTASAFNSGISGIGGTMRDLGTSLSATVTPAIMIAGSRLINYAEEIDSAFRDMRKTVNSSNEEIFESLRSAALEYSQTHKTSAQAMLEMEALGGQMGIAADALGKFGEVSSSLDIATNIGAEDIALYMGQFSNITHMATDDFERFGDALVRLGNNMPTQEDQIMRVAMRIGSLGTLAGMSQPQILAWSAAISSTGQKAEAAGTAISKTITNIETAVSEGGEDLELFAKTAGMSVDQFKAAWQVDASGVLRDFVMGLKELDEAGGSVDMRLEQLGITGVRQKQALFGLTQTIGTLNDAVYMSTNAWNNVSDEFGDAGDAAREAERKCQGFSGALALIQNNAAVLGDSVGTALTPYMFALADILKGVTDAFNSLDDNMKVAVIGVVAFTAAAGPLLRIFGQASQSLENIIPKLKKYSAEKEAGTGITKAANAEEQESVVVNTEAAASKTANAGATTTLTTAEKLATGAAKALNGAMKFLTIAGAVSAFVSLTAVVAGFAKSAIDSAYSADELRKSISDLKTSAKQSEEETTTLINVQSNSVQRTIETNDATKELINSYKDLSKKESRTSEEEDQLAYVRMKLASSSSEMAALIKDEGSSIDATADKLEILAEKQANVALAEAKQKSYNALLEKQYDLVSQRAIAQQQLNEAQEKQKKYYENIDFGQTPDQGGDFSLEGLFNAQAIKDAEENVASYDKQIETIRKSMKEWGVEIAKEEAHQAELNTAIRRFKSNGGDAEKAVAGLTISTTELDEELHSLEASADAAAAIFKDELETEVENLADTSNTFRYVLQAMGYDTESFAAYASNAGINVAEFAQQIDTMVDKAVDSLTALELAEQQTTDQTFSNLVNNKEYMERIFGDMAFLFQETGYKFNEYFISEVDKAPEQMAGIMEELNEAWLSGDEERIAEMQAYLDQYELTGQAAAEAVARGQAAKQEALNEVSGQLATDSADAMEKPEDFEAAAQVNADAALAPLIDAQPKAEQEGYNFGAGFANGIENSNGLATAAAQRLVSNALATVQQTQNSHSPAKASMEKGEDFGAGYGIGIANKTRFISQKAQQATEAALRALKYNPSDYANAASSVAQRANAAHYGALASAYTNSVVNSGASYGDTYNVYFNDNKVNDNEAIREGVIDLLYEARMVGEM